MSGEANALDALIDQALTDEYGDENWSELGSLRRITRAVLASDWLAARDAATADRARREGAVEAGERIAQAIEALGERKRGPYYAATMDAARIARSTP